MQTAQKQGTVACLVPQITIPFWVIKCCATTVGETISDAFNDGLGFGLGYTALLFYPLLIASLLLEFRIPVYVPGIYWFNVILMSICGTIFTDGLHDNLGLELWIEVIIFTFLMSASFYAWYRSEGTLDIHSVYTFKRLGYYWLAILFTFALGTAVGDGISEGSGWDFGPLVGFFFGIIVFIFALYKLNFLKPIPSFWFAYIMTRPLGASIGDLIGNQPNFSYGYTSVVFIGVIVAFTAYLTATGVDQIYPELCPESAEVKKNEADVESAKENNGEVKVAELERRHSDEVQPL